MFRVQGLWLTGQWVRVSRLRDLWACGVSARGSEFLRGLAVGIQASCSVRGSLLGSSRPQKGKLASTNRAVCRGEQTESLSSKRTSRSWTFRIDELATHLDSWLAARCTCHHGSWVLVKEFSLQFKLPQKGTLFKSRLFSLSRTQGGLLIFAQKGSLSKHWS